MFETFNIRQYKEKISHKINKYTFVKKSHFYFRKDLS